MASRLLLSLPLAFAPALRLFMNIITLIKTVFVVGVFALMVLIGLNNSNPVDFNLPPIISAAVKKPAAIMYFSFFAAGLLTGAVLSISMRKSNRQA